MGCSERQSLQKRKRRHIRQLKILTV